MEELFNRSHEYDRMLQQGLELSGETKEFFLQGRVADMRACLGGWRPAKVLDFGCGTGATSRVLAAAFPEAELVGADTAENALAYAREHVAAKNALFVKPEEIRGGGFDLIYLNCVFHHIEPKNRAAAAGLLRDALKPGGRLSYFENNPWNPGTRLVMRRIPFDRDAVPLAPPESRRMLQDAGFSLERPTRFLFYFPRPLGFLRFIEPALISIPLGAQYHVHARRP